LSRDLAAAERTLRGLLKDRPDDRAARLLLARVLGERGRLKEAKELFEAALQADSKDQEAIRGLARVLVASGDAAGAARWLRKATDLRPDDALVWKELGLAQKEAGDSIGAFASIQRSLTIDPDQADLSALVGDLVKAPSTLTIPGMNPRTGAFDQNPTRSAEPSLPGMNRPRQPGVDPLTPSVNRPGLR
jgi:tetratricopeptide (TPR) repeat protein